MTSQAYENFRNQGHALAGEPDAFGVRAGLYHRMYLESGKRNVFALIAAHGTLWGAGYFKKGLLGAWLLSLPYLLVPRVRRAKLRAVTEFADSFRAINRRVCSESYAIFHYTKNFGGTSYIRNAIGDELADILCECHASIDSGSGFTRVQRERLFSAYFNWEQDKVVAPLVTQAFEQMDWRVIKWLALRPKIDFTFLDKASHAQFSHFPSQAERVMHGMRLYRRAEEIGLAYAEQCLDRYPIKPVQDTAAVPCAKPDIAPASTRAPEATAQYC
jgi:hypothetical protein